MFPQRLIALTLFAALAASFLLSLPAMTWAQGFIQPTIDTPFEAPHELISIYSLLQYPEVAKKNGIEGEVKIRVLIEKDGSMSKMEIFGHSDTIFIAEAERIMKAERYRPAHTREGTHVEAWLTRVIYFSLPQKPGTILKNQSAF